MGTSALNTNTREYLVEHCREYIDRYRAQFAASIASDAAAVPSAFAYARALDGLLGSLFSAACATYLGPGAMASVALVATGGYGRRMMGLHSDVDLLVLAERPDDPQLAKVAELFLYPVWDAGLEAGHAVRSVDGTIALAKADLRTATTLLDMRLVAGNAEFVARVEASAFEDVFADEAAAFLATLHHDTEARRRRFGDSLYLLEPEVKLGCGGLRDLEACLWAARARWRAPSIQSLADHGCLLPREQDKLIAAREFMWKVRHLLHMRAGRQHDRLSFADQEEVALRLGYEDNDMLGVEHFMQDYYCHARIIAQSAERMLDRARFDGDGRAMESSSDNGEKRRGESAPEAKLSEGVEFVSGDLALRGEDALRDEPALALRLYSDVARLQKPVAPPTRDAVARVAVDSVWQRRFRESDEAKALFLQLLTTVAESPVRRRSILSELHEVSLLVAMIPEFAPLMGRVQHDVFHVYTVDVHSVAAVDRLRAVIRGEYESEWPLATQLASRLGQSTPLFLAVLLHDIGKGRKEGASEQRPLLQGAQSALPRVRREEPFKGGAAESGKARGHSEIGAELAQAICARLGISDGDTAHVVWLIEEHLSLYQWAIRRDVSDPQVRSEIAEKVRSIDRLRDLFLLTFVDLSTTNPKAMTSWKARMFETLFAEVADELEDTLGQGGEGRVAAVRREVREQLQGDDPSASAFSDEMPDRYLLANPVSAIVRHSLVAAADHGDEHVLSLGPQLDRDAWELVLSGPDRPGLLALVAGALAAHRLEIVSAQVYTRSGAGSGRAFDVFDVRRFQEGGRPITNAEITRVCGALRAAIRGDISSDALADQIRRAPRWATRRSPEVVSEVHIDNAASPASTVVEVYGRDEPGLLYALARTITDAGLSITVSKVSTEGHRASDVFYVQNGEGDKIRDVEALDNLRAKLQSALNSFYAAEN